MRRARSNAGQAAGARVFACAFGTLLWPGSALAEMSATAEVEAPAPVDHPDDATAAVSRVAARDRPAAAESVPELLLEVPGARVLSTGGHGASVGLSLRGAELDQTRVYLGALPLDGPEGGSFDLSTIPLEVVDAVEVARGPAPAWWSEGAIGGVLRLEPRSHVAPTVTLFGGSFGLLGLGATAGVGGANDRDPGLWMAIQVGRAENDFPYTDDQLTALDPTDDVERPRRNADARDATALVHGTTPAGAHGRLETTLLGFVREAGAPGPGGRDTRDARQSSTRGVGSAAYRVEDPSGRRLELVLGGGYERRRLDDPLGELGGFTAYDDRLARAFARAATTVPATPWLEGTAVATWRWDGLESPIEGVQTGGRHAGAVTTEARFFGTTPGDVGFEVRPSVRVEVARTLVGSGPQEDAGQTQVAPTARLGAAIRPSDAWVVMASVGSGTRLPSLLELFGDRVLLLGDPALDPERSLSTDVGVAGRLRQGPLRARVELRGFALFQEDGIVYARSTDGWLRPENVGESRVLGLEARARMGLGAHVDVVGTFTALHARETVLDATLPYRPSMLGYVRVEGRTPRLGPLDTVRPYVDLAAVGETAVDLAGLGVLPARAIVGLGLRAPLDRGRWEVAVSVRDVFDRRGPDLVGFPLPGRRFAASVTWRGGP